MPSSVIVYTAPVSATTICNPVAPLGNDGIKFSSYRQSKTHTHTYTHTHTHTNTHIYQKAISLKYSNYLWYKMSHKLKHVPSLFLWHHTCEFLWVTTLMTTRAVARIFLTDLLVMYTVITGDYHKFAHFTFHYREAITRARKLNVCVYESKSNYMKNEDLQVIKTHLAYMWK